MIMAITIAPTPIPRTIIIIGSMAVVRFFDCLFAFLLKINGQFQQYFIKLARLFTDTDHLMENRREYLEVALWLLTAQCLFHLAVDFLEGIAVNDIIHTLSDDLQSLQQGNSGTQQ